MGAVGALVVCMLTVLLAKGSYLPGGDKNQRHDPKSMQKDLATGIATLAASVFTSVWSWFSDAEEVKLEKMKWMRYVAHIKLMHLKNKSENPKSKSDLAASDVHGLDATAASDVRNLVHGLNATAASDVHNLNATAAAT